MTIIQAEREDLEAILQLQYLAYQSEAVLLQNFSIPPLKQTLTDLEAEFERGIVLKAEEGGMIVGSVRAYCEDGTARIGKLIVDPAFQAELARRAGVSLPAGNGSGFPRVNVRDGSNAPATGPMAQWPNGKRFICYREFTTIAHQCNP